MPIRAILFDADGVVIHPMMQFARHLQEQYGLNQERTAPFFRGVFDDCLAGRISLEDALPPFLQEWGWPGDADQFIALWMREDDHPHLPLLEKIQELRRCGLLCGLATLQERRRAAYMRTRMNFSSLFDRLYFSCELGCLKPDPHFFHLIQADLGLEGHEILFWDDAPQNVQTALSVGWRAELYTTYEGFEKKLPGWLSYQT